MTKRNATVTSIDNSNLDEANADIELQIEIRRRAYEIYEQRGKQDGLAEQDWLQAEAEIINMATMKAAA